MYRPTYLPTLKDYRSLHLSIRSRSFLRAGSRCASRIDPDRGLQDSDPRFGFRSNGRAGVGSREVGKSHGMRECLLRAMLFCEMPNRRTRLSKIFVHTFHLKRLIGILIGANMRIRIALFSASDFHTLISSLFIFNKSRRMSFDLIEIYVDS